MTRQKVCDENQIRKDIRKFINGQMTEAAVIKMHNLTNKQFLRYLSQYDDLISSSSSSPPKMMMRRQILKKQDKIQMDPIDQIAKRGSCIKQPPISSCTAQKSKVCIDKILKNKKPGRQFRPASNTMSDVDYPERIYPEKIAYCPKRRQECDKNDNDLFDMFESMKIKSNSPDKRSGSCSKIIQSKKCDNLSSRSSSTSKSSRSNSFCTDLTSDQINSSDPNTQNISLIMTNKTDKPTICNIVKSNDKICVNFDARRTPVVRECISELESHKYPHSSLEKAAKRRKCSYNIRNYPPSFESSSTATSVSVMNSRKRPKYSNQLKRNHANCSDTSSTNLSPCKKQCSRNLTDSSSSNQFNSTSANDETNNANFKNNSSYKLNKCSKWIDDSLKLMTSTNLVDKHNKIINQQKNYL